jgi:LysR family transcriptional regulator, chromosome initiation inhibitor
MHNLDPAALACLAAIVDEGSFEGAAQALAITQSAVSHRLKALESAVGQPMLVRSRPLVLTQTGKLLLRYARQINAMQVDLARDLSHNERVLDERIPIAVNADSLATWIPRALNLVVQRGIRLEILVDDQDFTHDWLKQGSVLGCVSTVAHALQGCSATPLGSMRYVAAASPKVAKMIHAKGFSAQTLAEHPFVVFNRKDDMQRQWAAKALGLKRVRLLETFVPSTEASVRAMLLGWGIGVAPELLIAPLIAKGQLVAIEPTKAIDVQLFWHRWSVSSATLDWIGDALIAKGPNL